MRYPVIGLLPAGGAVHDSWTPVRKNQGCAAVSVGVPGGVAACGVAGCAAERFPSPAELTALTWYQYVCPLTRPLSTNVVPVPGGATRRVVAPLELPRKIR